MSNIDVYLTTTKHLVASDSNPDKLIDLNIPVCAANMNITVFGNTASEQEMFELNWAQNCITMAKFVFVDTQKRFIYVGDDLEHKQDTGLIEYVTDSKDLCSDDFFERWDVIKSMMLEFTVYDEKKPLFCIKGVWLIDRWYKLDIYPRNFIEIAPPPSCS